jgi:IS30 family transposase
MHMAKTGRPGLSESQLAEFWQQWRAGQSMSGIGQALGRDRSSIHYVARCYGGIAPAPRRRSPLALSLVEREEISRGIAVGRSIRGIATALGRAPSTICREIARHGGPYGYRATEADRNAWHAARRPKPCLLSSNGRLRRIVAGKLSLDWSPEQISGWLKAQYPHDENMRVSHETIYRSLFIQARGVLKKELTRHLRSQRVTRRSRNLDRQAQSRGQLIGAVSIRERPAEAADRAIPGHWEGDLLCGSNNSHIVTLVERHSRFTALIKVPNRETDTVVSALTRHVRKLPASLRRSLTWDRGKEMANHQSFTIATDVQVYFCDPQSPWQRRTNENTNRLLRQYFPKRTDLSLHPQSALDRIALRLNQRPRETLGFRTPADKLAQTVASIR